MPTENTDRSLSEDEIDLRVTVPEFFQELINTRTATLVQQGDPEALTAWKEIREQRDREFSELTPEAKQAVLVKHGQKSFELQSIEFAASFARYAEQHNIPFDLEHPLQAVHAYERIRGEQRESMSLPPAKESGRILAHEETPREDMRFVVAREIHAAKEHHREMTEPAQNSFQEMSQTAKDEFLAEQKQVGKEALKAQELSIQQTLDRSNEPPDRER